MGKGVLLLLQTCIAGILTFSHLTAVGVAKSGAESVKPVLQQLYRTRAAAYQEAVRSFVEVLALFLCMPATTWLTAVTSDMLMKEPRL